MHFRFLVFSTLLVSATAGQSAPLDEVGQECAAQLGMNEAGCNCIVEMAQEQLSEKQILFLLAKVRRDQQGERDLAMQGTEALQVVQFMNAAPVACQNQ